MNNMAISPITGACGAEISGVQINALGNAEFDGIVEALVTHGAVFFRDQNIELDELVAFGRRFGALEVHPIVDGMAHAPEITKVLKPAGESASFGTGWHTDNSFFEKPSMGSVLFGKTIPPYGGDTVFANQYLAYEKLSAKMKHMLDGLKAVHSASRAYTVDGTKENMKRKPPSPIAGQSLLWMRWCTLWFAPIRSVGAMRFMSMICSRCALKA